MTNQILFQKGHDNIETLTNSIKAKEAERSSEGTLYYPGGLLNLPDCLDPSYAMSYLWLDYDLETDPV